MLQLTITNIDEDMRTPRGTDYQFTRELDADDFMDMAEDMLEATRSFPFKSPPTMCLNDPAGRLWIQADEGQLYWSRPDESGTERVVTTARELADIFFSAVS
ncbi:MAG: hypothetical protein AAGF10_00075 [Verrucomicrobiota bacterium]